MTKTQQRLVERAQAALARGRLQSGTRGDAGIVQGLIDLVKRLDSERSEYLERWLEETA